MAGGLQKKKREGAPTTKGALPGKKKKRATAVPKIKKGY
jgi:hypothetical protein